MPAVHECPSCEKKIKIPDGAEGKKLKCPGCQTPLLITEDGLELAQKQAVQPAAKPARKAPPPDEDDEDEAPKAKKRKPVDDDDDEDEDEPKPKKRKAADEDEDEDDRPSKKRKKFGAGMPMWVWLAAGGGGVVVVLLILFLFVFGGGSSKLAQVKEGMSEKEVVDLLGQPTIGDTKNTGIWFHPQINKADAGNFEKLASVKERLTVLFKDGKVKSAKVASAAEMQKGG